jgi:transcriptional regulator with XRE-family HTH domain
MLRSLAMATLEERCAGWFRQQLKDRDLTQEAAARDLDVTLATISRWTRGQSLPSFRDLFSIKKAWGELPPPLG